MPLQPVRRVVLALLLAILAPPGAAPLGQGYYQPYGAPAYPGQGYPPPAYPTQPYGRPQYGQPPYGQPSYGQPQYGQPQYGQPGQVPQDGGEEGDLAAEMLAAHNRVRAGLGLPALQWSPQVAAVAQRWARRLQAEGCQMRHSGTEDYGENLAWSAGREMSPAEVVRLWVDEAGSYDRAANRCAPGAVCGHYTQVVWRSTRLLGCAVAHCAGSEVWVCNYDPPGNYVGHRPY